MRKTYIKLFSVLLALIIVACPVFSRINVQAATKKTGQEEENVTAQPVQQQVYADSPYIILDSYSLKGEKIIPGEDFDLHISIKNPSETTTVRGVLVNISNPYYVIPEYGTTSQQYVGDMAPGEVKELVFRYYALEDLADIALDFNMSAISDTKTNYIVLTVPVGVSVPFTVISSTYPDSIYANYVYAAAVTFKVKGEDKVENVALITEIEGLKTMTENIGSLSAGVTKTQSVSLSVETPGVYTTNVYLQYSDQEGQTQKTRLETKTIQVVERPADEVDTEDTDSARTQDNEDVMIIGGSAALIVILLALVFVIARKKR